MKLYQDVAGTTPATQPGHPVGLVVSQAGRINHSQPTALSKPMLARHPKSGVRNLANGAQAVSDNTYWPASRTEVGVTITRAGWGMEDGVPYVDLDYTGTATAAGMRPAYVNSVATRTPVVEGDVLRSMATVAVIAGADQLALDDGARLDIAGYVGTSQQQSSISALVRTSSPVGLQVSRNTLPSETAVAAQVGLRLSPGSTVAGVRIRIKGLQLFRGLNAQPFQFNYGPNDITEEGVPDLWHLYNDGGDSLNAVYPAGTYGVGYLSADLVPTFTTVISDGVTSISSLFTERQADVVIRPGEFTQADKDKIIESWGRI